jgi:hypothetical protein
MTDPLARFNDDYERQLAVLAKIDAALDAQRQRIHQFAHEDSVGVATGPTPQAIE